MSDWCVCLKPVAEQLHDLVLSSFHASVSSSVKQINEKKQWGFGEAMQVKYELNHQKFSVETLVLSVAYRSPDCMASIEPAPKLLADLALSVV